jgi:hypothetical protein
LHPAYRRQASHLCEATLYFFASLRLCAPKRTALKVIYNPSNSVLDQRFIKVNQ